MLKERNETKNYAKLIEVMSIYLKQLNTGIAIGILLSLVNTVLIITLLCRI